jgi:hypothetical protein
VDVEDTGRCLRSLLLYSLPTADTLCTNNLQGPRDSMERKIRGQMRPFLKFSELLAEDHTENLLLILTGQSLRLTSMKVWQHLGEDLKMVSLAPPKFPLSFTCSGYCSSWRAATRKWRRMFTTAPSCKCLSWSGYKDICAFSMPKDQRYSLFEALFRTRPIAWM